MLIEPDHIGRLQAAGGMGGQEQFVDVLSQLFTDRRLLTMGRGCPFGDNHPAPQLVLEQGLQPIREVAHLVDGSPDPRLWMHQFQIARASEPRLYFGMREQLLVPPTRQKAQACLLNAGQDRGVSIQAIQPQQPVRERDVLSP